MTTINVEILKKRMEDMSNYDMDEIERLKEKEKRKKKNFFFKQKTAYEV